MRGQVRPAFRGPLGPDDVALAEIELCCELMIAAAAASEERLSADRIDEVLRSAPGPAELGAQARYWAWGRLGGDVAGSS